MNLLRKSSMTLLGAVAAGLLAFACADADGVAADSSEVNAAANVRATDLVISAVYAGGGNKIDGQVIMDGDYVELFNPTKEAISLKGLALQTQPRKKEGFEKTASVALPDVKVESQHYFLVSFTEKATFGFADGKKADLVLKGHDNDLIVGGAAVALVAGDALCNGECDGPRDLVGWGYADQDKKIPVQSLNAPAPTPANSGEAIVRRGNGCYDSSKNDADFTASAPAPRTSADTFDCESLAAQPQESDAGADSATNETPDAGDAAVDEPNEPSKDAGADSGKPTNPSKPDAGAPSTGGDEDEDEDTGPTASTPEPTGGKKKKSSANAPPQPIAASSPSCSTTSGPASSGGLAGLAGLGLALAALGRRRKS